MQLGIFDISALSVVALSGIFGAARGFTRETLTLAAWIGAMIVAWIAYDRFQDLARIYVAPEWLADATLAASSFVAALVILTLITMRVPEWVLDSDLAFVDRALGLGFGIARGAALVAVGYLALTWFVSPQRLAAWGNTSPTYPAVVGAAETLRAAMPETWKTYVDDLLDPAGDDAEIFGPPTYAQWREHLKTRSEDQSPYSDEARRALENSPLMSPDDTTTLNPDEANAPNDPHDDRHDRP